MRRNIRGRIDDIVLFHYMDKRSGLMEQLGMACMFIFALVVAIVAGGM